ncbi:helix-turn-helix domain-containing protein [Streptomyces sp. NPDC085639]|uniref:helix-turn-helix domain-containing protein n=1 Tax=Streptomyces sp. NPDC085639 TaxID=3365734 RepID=UPI0037D3B0F7
MRRETLEVSLADNCSWARPAEALHLHVNTVHYRIERVEVLTGRDLSLLDHKLDLYAALRMTLTGCGGRAATAVRCGPRWASRGP